MKKVQYLNRSLIVGPYLALFLDYDALCHEMSDLKMPHTMWPEPATDTDARTLVRYRKGACYCYVLIDNPNLDFARAVEVLCHEAVHVVQAHWNDVGEKHLGDETMAYSVQHVFKQLFLDYCRQKRIKLPTLKGAK